AVPTSPPVIEDPVPVLSNLAGWKPGAAPTGHLAHRPQERLLPITFSTPHTATMQITNANAAATRPLVRIERRCRTGRFANQSRAARIRPTKLARRSGRPGKVSGSSERPAFLRSPHDRSLLGTSLTRTSRTRLEALSM
ncbi:hypothetical protein AVDCRST_MAG82-62, partial [uncultured Rubrobacteraceae bacterium]